MEKVSDSQQFWLLQNKVDISFLLYSIFTTAMTSGFTSDLNDVFLIYKQAILW